MKIKEEEKEKIKFKFLKRLDKHWFWKHKILKKLNSNFWGYYDVIYGKGFTSHLLEVMRQEGLVYVNKRRRYRLTERGEKILKRGWIYSEKKWYDEPKIRKYSFILSVLAIIISLVGTDNIRRLFWYLWHLVF